MYGHTYSKSKDHRESAGSGPVVLKVVPVMGASFVQVTMDQLINVHLSLFPTPTRDSIGMKWL